MIKPIMTVMPSFKADKQTIDIKTGEYKDPLMKWPLRGAAFTSEVGESLRPLIGGYATLGWIPVFLYIGADLYDKYKNDQTEYSPDSKRLLKQAVFQGLASVILPLVAIKFGQNAFGQIGKLTNDKISYKAVEHISHKAENFIANGKMRAFEGKDKECINDFVELVNSSLDYRINKKSLNNSTRIFKKSKDENIENYAKKTIEDLIKLRKDLLNPTDEMKKSKWYAKYTKALKKGQTESVAIKSVLTDFQKKKMLKGDLIKTLGGFTAVGLAIQPIDKFVEHVLIDKYLGPKIDNYQKKK